MHPPLLVTGGIGILVLWRLVTRIRRNFGRQTLAVNRQRFLIGFMPFLALMFGGFAVAQGMFPAGLLLGVAAGLALGWFGLRTMHLHPPGESAALHYTPNPYIGAVLTVAVVGRMGYRWLPVLMGGELPTETPHLTFATLLLVGALLAYYWAVAFGLLRWRRRVLAAN